MPGKSLVPYLRNSPGHPAAHLHSLGPYGLRALSAGMPWQQQPAGQAAAPEGQAQIKIKVGHTIYWPSRPLVGAHVAEGGQAKGTKQQSCRVRLMTNDEQQAGHLSGMQPTSCKHKREGGERYCKTEIKMDGKMVVGNSVVYSTHE